MTFLDGKDPESLAQDDGFTWQAWRDQYGPRDDTWQRALQMSLDRYDRSLHQNQNQNQNQNGSSGVQDA